MQHLQAPRADFALLSYLGCVTALLALFASAFYGMMQPTVIPNAGLAAYKAPGPASIFLHKADASAESMERAAVAAAKADNKEQGIEPLRAFASLESGQGNSSKLDNNGAATPPAKSAKPKPRRVAKQDTFSDPWRSSWNSPWGSWNDRRWNNRSSRPLWAFRDGF